jgi:CSLREA domain-containing protein
MLTVGVALLAAVSASAATFNVDTTIDLDDPTPGDGLCGAPCSLRAALQEVNALAQLDLASEHTVMIPAGVYSMPILWGAPGPGRPFVIAANVTLEGAGVPATMCAPGSCTGVPFERATVLEGTPRNRVLDVISPTFEWFTGERNRVTIRDLGIRRGYVAHTPATAGLGGQPLGGGGLRIGRFSAVSLRNVALQGNTAEAGGAIDNAGHLWMDQVSITRNRVLDWHPAGTPYVVVPGDMCGGGVRSSGRMEARGSVVAENAGARKGGGICGRVSDGRGWRPVDACPQDGTCVTHPEVGSLVVANSIVRDNEARTAGGGIHVDILFRGMRAHVVESVVRANRVAHGQGGGLDLSGPGVVDLPGVTVEGNRASLVHEGLSRDVHPGVGGGIFSASWARISDSSIRGNIAQFGGGGIATRRWRDAAGVELSNGLTVERSLIADNEAGGGGGIYNISGDVGLGNSTLRGNRAVGSEGGALLSYGAVRLDFVTIAHNQAARGGSAIRSGRGSLRMRASLIANDCSISETEVTTGGYNFINAAGCTIGLAPAAGDLFVFDWDTGLLPLADNGGPTHTMALAESSPAVDRVPLAACPDTTVDQRSFARPRGAGCDAGAFERQPLLFSLIPCCSDIVFRFREGVSAAEATARLLPGLVASAPNGEAQKLASALVAQARGLAKDATTLEQPSDEEVWVRLSRLRSTTAAMSRTADRLASLVKGPALGRTRKLQAELRVLDGDLKRLERRVGVGGAPRPAGSRQARLVPGPIL